MTDTPIYDDTIAWQRRESQRRTWDELFEVTVPEFLALPVPETQHLTPWPSLKKETFMSRRDVQLLFWSMIIAGFFGVMFALALNGWFD